MKKFILLTILFVGILIINACSKKSGTAGTSVTTDPSITYAKDIAPIMTAYCTSCHSGYGTKNGVVSSINSIISSIQNGSMPPGSNKVSSADLNKLKTWDRVQ